MPQFCPFCGTPHEVAWAFCPACGKSILNIANEKQPIGDPAPPQTSTVSGRASSSQATHPHTSWAKGAIGVAILFIAGIAYYFVGGRFKGSSTSPAQISASEEADTKLVGQTGLRHQLTPEQIYNSVAPAVVLITNYDAHAHKRALGSGFLISSQGDIATNYHVIRGAYQAEVKFTDGTESPVTGVVGYNPEHDVAVIRVAQLPATSPLHFGNSDSLKIGDSLLAVGSPLGLESTLSQGILSARRSGILQMTTPISPGSSGGPVLDQFGQVVGISDAYAPAGENINFAVPIIWVKPYVGRSPQQTLEEVAQENAASVPVSINFSVPARQFRIFPLKITENMADPELDLSFASRGGINSVVDLRVIEGQRIIWDSGRADSGQCQIDLPGPGAYQIVFDNRPSTIFARTVTLNGQLQFVK